MPLAQFTDERRGIKITKGFLTPKRMSEIKYWMKAAKAAIPEIPQEITEVEGQQSANPLAWYLYMIDSNLDWINFDIRNGIGERAYITIKRRA